MTDPDGMMRNLTADQAEQTAKVYDKMQSDAANAAGAQDSQNAVNATLERMGHGNEGIRTSPLTSIAGNPSKASLDGATTRVSDNNGNDDKKSDMGEGSSYFQQNRYLAPSNFNFQPSFGTNWQAAGIKGIIIDTENDGPYEFNIEVGMPTYSVKLGREITRGEAQKLSARAYIGAVNEVNAAYSSGWLNPAKIPSAIAAAMQLNINFMLHGKGLATVSTRLGTNPGAPVRMADFSLKK
jgi:hypothetical protein